MAQLQVRQETGDVVLVAVAIPPPAHTRASLWFRVWDVTSRLEYIAPVAVGVAPPAHTSVAVTPTVLTTLYMRSMMACSPI